MTNDLATDAMDRLAAVSGRCCLHYAGRRRALRSALCALRLCTGSLLAPMAVHAATNTVFLVAAYAVLGAS